MDARRMALLAALGSYEQSGAIRFLDQAIDLLRELASATDPPDADVLNVLCGKLWERCGRTGNLRDLDECIDRMRALVRRLDDADPRHPGLLHNLGLGLSERFRRLLRPANLDEAIRHYRSAIAMGAARGAVNPLWRNNLANALRDRAHLDRDVRYLDEAISVHETLVRETPGADRDWRIHRSNLANDLLDRYGWSAESAGDPALLDRAAELLLQAAHRPSGGPEDRPAMLAVFAEALMRRGFEQGRVELDDEVRLLFRVAVLAGLRDAPALAMRTAVNWGRAEFAGRRWGEAREALEHALDAADRLAATHAARAERQAWLRETQQVAELLAYACVQLDRPEDAVLGVERALGRTRLPAGEPAGAAERAGRTRAALACAARAAPLVYLCGTLHGGVALVVRAPTPGDVRVSALPLPGFTEAFLEARLRYLFGTRDSGRLDAWRAALDDTGRALGWACMDAVLAAVAPAGRATLVPVGRVGLLPLQAAWSPDAAGGGRRYAMDRVSLAFAGSARALAAARAPDLSSARTILVVQDRSLPGSGPEAESVSRGFDALRVQDAARPREELLAAMGTCDVLHLCCHARAEPFSPDDAALRLPGGGRISVVEIEGLDLRRVRLAVLAACEAGSAGEVLPDEGVSVAAAFAAAGVPCVVASDWRVRDAATVLLMIHFYHLWRHEGRPAPDALRAAQRWLRERTGGELAAQLALYPDHAISPAARGWLADCLGADRAARPFASADHWAAFRWYGAVPAA